MVENIEGVIKHYNWGGYDFLPKLLNIEKTGEPFAEYWLGTHPDGDAKVVGHNSTLSSFLSHVLPFLLKVLDVRDMLSIQVHPDKNTADKGFAEEEECGTPRKAFNRVFKDSNHKPELMVALSDFWLLQGFKPIENILYSLQHNAELKKIADYLRQFGLEKTYYYLMTMAQSEVNDILKPLGKRIKPLYLQGALEKNDINFWSARAFLTFNKKGVCDRGIFSLYLMNLVRLKKGEGIFQAPGVLHAYLEGQNVECMAASDNVVRGGLTDKYIDTTRLIDIVKFETIIPQVISASENGSYETPASEFRLTRISHGSEIPIIGRSILINLGKETALIHGNEQWELKTGQSVFVDSAIPTQLKLAEPSNDQYLFLASAAVPFNG